MLCVVCDVCVWGGREVWEVCVCEGRCGVSRDLDQQLPVTWCTTHSAACAASRLGFFICLFHAHTSHTTTHSAHAGHLCARIRSCRQGRRLHTTTHAGPGADTRAHNAQCSHRFQDTYALAFAGASKADAFTQVQVPPGAALTWREKMLKIKETRA